MSMEGLIVLAILLIAGFVANRILSGLASPETSEDGATIVLVFLFLGSCVIFPDALPFGLAFMIGYMLSAVWRSHEAVKTARARKTLEGIESFSDLLRKWRL